LMQNKVGMTILVVEARANPRHVSRSKSQEL
jgi:hypothetical protein